MPKRVNVADELIASLNEAVEIMERRWRRPGFGIRLPR